jgi:hypothetical protein
MARYIVRKSYVDVLGRLWMPQCLAATRIALSSYDVANIQGQHDWATDSEGGTIDRDAVEQWLMLHSGDFSEVIDFSASIESGDQTLDFDWANEESQFYWQDCMHPVED